MRDQKRLIWLIFLIDWWVKDVVRSQKSDQSVHGHNDMWLMLSFILKELFKDLMFRFWSNCYKVTVFKLILQAAHVVLRGVSNILSTLPPKCCYFEQTGNTHMNKRIYACTDVCQGFRTGCELAPLQLPVHTADWSILDLNLATLPLPSQPFICSAVISPYYFCSG